MANDTTILTEISTLVDLFDGADFELTTPLNQVTFQQYLDTVEDAKTLQREILKRDKRQDINKLPVEEVGGERILSSIDRNTVFDAFFESASSEILKSGATENNAFLITGEAFLGQSIFRYNAVAFDANPATVVERGARPIFPGHDPIYGYSTKDDLLDYIYTTIYPKKTIPSFPNFVVNGFIIDGEVYNPLYDFRNYRLFGDYKLQDNRVKGYDLFDSKSVGLVVQGMNRGKFFKYGENYYCIKRNNNNSAPEPASIFNGIQQWVKPSQVKFAKVSKAVYDANPSLQVSGL